MKIETDEKSTALLDAIHDEMRVIIDDIRHQTYTEAENFDWVYFMETAQKGMDLFLKRKSI
jgi:hypothetical protein